mmetsp:Transcript_21948/g.38865  ORF Transcript_21948/g.38865 Transcript_21948/m.38865 type:complete len:192 (-) Transcript_21948:882-1457(-)
MREKRESVSQDPNKVALGKAIDDAKRAIQADTDCMLPDAYRHYQNALMRFANILASNTVPNMHPVIVEKMMSYLNRMSELEPLICSGNWAEKKDQGGTTDRFKERIKLYMVMAQTAPFDPKSYGEEKNLAGDVEEKLGNVRKAFRLYNEGLEFFMACHKLAKSDGKAPPASLTASITKMLDAAERLKSKLD